MAVSMEHCKNLEGRIVDLRVGEACTVDRPAFRCRLVAAEVKGGEEVIYVEPVDNSGIGLALPMRQVQSIALSERSPVLLQT